MFNGLGILIALACICLVYFTVCFAIDRKKAADAEWANGAPRRKHLATKQALNRRPYDSDSAHDARKAEQANLALMGVPAVHAGNFLDNLPPLNEDKSWEARQQVLTTARLVAYSPYGVDTADLVELGHGYLLLARRKGVLLLKQYPLTATEGDLLTREFKEATGGTGDSVRYIKSFCGQRWEIGSALGQNMTPKAGEKSCGYIQLLTVHPELGQVGKISTYPANLMDGAEHDVYDLRAHDSSGQVLFAFYTAGDWSCYIGRQLPPYEAQGLKAI